MRRIAVAATLFLLSACAADGSSGQFVAPTSAQRLEADLAGLSAGSPERCIDKNRVVQVEGYADAIVFSEGDTLKYRSAVTGCRGLGRGDLPVINTIRPSQYCEGDVVQTRRVLGGQLSGSCALGPMVPFRGDAQ